MACWRPAGSVVDGVQVTGRWQPWQQEGCGPRCGPAQASRLEWQLRAEQPSSWELWQPVREASLQTRIPGESLGTLWNGMETSARVQLMCCFPCAKGVHDTLKIP